MRVQSHNLKPGERYRVLLDGEDVSDYCLMADDVEGEVCLVDGDELDANGDVPTTLRRGRVVIQPATDVSRETLA